MMPAGKSPRKTRENIGNLLTPLTIGTCLSEGYRMRLSHFVSWPSKFDSGLKVFRAAHRKQLQLYAIVTQSLASLLRKQQEMGKWDQAHEFLRGLSFE